MGLEQVFPHSEMQKVKWGVEQNHTSTFEALPWSQSRSDPQAELTHLANLKVRGSREYVLPIRYPK